MIPEHPGPKISLSPELVSAQKRIAELEGGIKAPSKWWVRRATETIARMQAAEAQLEALADNAAKWRAVEEILSPRSDLKPDDLPKILDGLNAENARLREALGDIQKCFLMEAMRDIAKAALAREK